jgi:hypothetical protein
LWILYKGAADWQAIIDLLKWYCHKPSWYTFSISSGKNEDSFQVPHFEKKRGGKGKIDRQEFIEKLPHGLLHNDFTTFSKLKGDGYARNQEYSFSM